ncbi:MAG TPA: D-alanyl-D-alanine carboxypeptidase [Motilibacteraceae bacterium]|nr:D-alanyl-D-alanine carboxypeptidase [Motilibacteraceae bacterium]
MTRPVRRAVLVLLAVLVVVAAVVGGLVATGRLPAGTGGSPAAAATPTPSLPGPAVAPAPSVLPPLPAAAPAPDPVALARLLDPLLASPAFGKGSAGASVLDASTGEVLYARDAAAPRTPASVTKLATAVAVLQDVGADARLRTRVVAGARPGDLVLVGAGDPTLTAQPPSAVAGDDLPDRASLVALADATAAALRPLAPAEVHVGVDDGLFTGPAASPSWPPSYVGEGIVAPVHALAVDEARVDPRSTGQAPRVQDPALDAGRRFAALLAARGLRVAGEVTREAAPPAGQPRTPWVQPGAATGGPVSDVPSEAAGGPSEGASGQETGSSSAGAGAASPGGVVASVDSPPMSVLVGHMLRISDDDLAEALGRIAALGSGRPGSFDGASQALLAVLGGPSAGRLHDASGLSRDNALAPRAVARLLARVADPSSDSSSETPTARPSGSPSAAAGGALRPLPPEVRAAVLDGLPVAGFTGTLDDRFAVGDGAGAVRAKTGTLTGVSSLAGLVVDADGRLLVFAVLSDSVTDTLQARAALDRVAAALAGCGCR